MLNSDFYDNGAALPILHDDPVLNREIQIQALCSRLDTARRALAAAAAMQVVEPKLRAIKDNAAWAMNETDPRRFMPKSAAKFPEDANKKFGLGFHNIVEVLGACAGLLDNIKAEWGNDWSAYDQAVREAVTWHMCNPSGQADEATEVPAWYVVHTPGADFDWSFFETLEGAEEIQREAEENDRPEIIPLYRRAKP
jgi:hypothetical protein